MHNNSFNFNRYLNSENLRLYWRTFRFYRRHLLFIIISLIYAIGQYVILKLIVVRESFKTHTMIIVHKSVVIIQYVLIAFLLITIVQMISTSSYSSIILKIVTWINYSMSIVFQVLAKKFISWYSTRRNTVLIAYAIVYGISLYGKYCVNH